MKNTSKAILGHRIGTRLFFSEEERRIIIEDYLSGNETKQSVYKRYTGYEFEHGKIKKWMVQLNIEDRNRKGGKFVHMAKQKNETAVVKMKSDEFEILKLEKRISELEKQLQMAEMKAIAFSTMVDIAEKEFKIPIRKKFNAKPSK